MYLFFLTWSTAQTPQTVVNAQIYIPHVVRFRQSRLSVRLRCRRRTTDSFNANESAKHAYFIQYVSVPHFFQHIVPDAIWVGLKCGPCGGCRVFKLVARFSLLAEFRFFKVEQLSTTINATSIIFELQCRRSRSSNGRASWFYLLSRPRRGGSVDIDIIVDLSLYHPDYTKIIYKYFLQAVGIEPTVPSNPPPCGTCINIR